VPKWPILRRALAHSQMRREPTPFQCGLPPACLSANPKEGDLLVYLDKDTRQSIRCVRPSFSASAPQQHFARKLESNLKSPEAKRAIANKNLTDGDLRLAARSVQDMLGHASLNTNAGAAASHVEGQDDEVPILNANPALPRGQHRLYDALAQQRRPQSRVGCIVCGMDR
jgi:hypothetical protein